jgi:hypothetical protein
VGRVHFEGRSLLAAGILFCAISSAVGAEETPQTDSLIGYTQFRVNLPAGRHANAVTMRAYTAHTE